MKVENLGCRSVEYSDVKGEDGKSSCNANNMSLDDLERHLQLDKLNESNNSKMDSVESSSNSEYSGRNEMKDRKREKMSNEHDAIECKKSNNETEDNRTLANGEDLSAEIKDVEEENLWLRNIEVQ